MFQRYDQFWLFRKGSSNSFFTTFCVWFFKKMFLMLYCTNWPNFIAWLPLLLEILVSICQNTCIGVNIGQNTCAGVLFDKAAGLRACIFNKKRLQLSIFLWNLRDFKNTFFYRTRPEAASDVFCQGRKLPFTMCITDINQAFIFSR